MKILVLSNYFPPYYIGGYELACSDTVKYLKDAGHDVYVLTGEHIKRSSQFERVYRKLKYIDYENPSYFNKFETEKFNFETTKKVIEKVNPDLVYIWSLRLISLSPIWAVERLKVKKVFEIGDFWMRGFLSNSFISRLKRSLKHFFPKSYAVDVKIDPIISVSEWMTNEMKELYGSKNIFFVPNGTTVSELKYEKDTKLMKYMFCGRIDKTKGLHLAIKALSNLKDRKYRSFQFNIYGDGDIKYIQKCKNLVRVLNLEENVFFHGKVNDLSKEYINNHVLLMPTIMREPFGLVLIEAMNYGVVNIATNDYGPSEIIEDGRDGLLFIPNNVDDLTSKILQVHKNWELLEEYRKNAYEKVERKYDLRIVKQKVESILLKVAGKEK